MLQLNNRFVFVRTLAENMQSVVEILQLIHDFLTVVTKLDHLSIYFSMFRIEMCHRSRMIRALFFSTAAGG